MLRNECRGHIQHLSFGLVGVGDKTALKPCAGAGTVGAGGGDQTAGATLGGGELQALLHQNLRQIGGKRRSTATLEVGTHVATDASLSSVVKALAANAAVESITSVIRVEGI